MWRETTPTVIDLAGGELAHVIVEGGEQRDNPVTPPAYTLRDGRFAGPERLAWHEVALEEVYADAAFAKPFAGTVDPAVEDGAGGGRDRIRGAVRPAPSRTPPR